MFGGTRGLFGSGADAALVERKGATGPLRGVEKVMGPTRRIVSAVVPYRQIWLPLLNRVVQRVAAVPVTYDGGGLDLKKG